MDPSTWQYLSSQPGTNKRTQSYNDLTADLVVTNNPAEQDAKGELSDGSRFWNTKYVGIRVRRRTDWHENSRTSQKEESL